MWDFFRSWWDDDDDDDDLEMAPVDPGALDLADLAEQLRELEDLAAYLGVDLDDNADLLMELLPDWQIAHDIEIMPMDDDGDDHLSDFAAWLLEQGLEISPQEVQTAIELWAESIDGEIAAIFSRPDEAAAYAVEAPPGILEVVAGDDGLYYVIRCDSQGRLHVEAE